ncbi:hypothetical protein TL16_g11634 [Triparma laevis f. inornata]|uniref:Uncharacterized protein n=1 Tax=Triparma laevis f. inornata TaxID=1714386 RepID=A0A9W7BK72_9STRA|nr:hypothetical protein TL16_g11634 [Triparma laevis f. inornata]
MAMQTYLTKFDGSTSLLTSLSSFGNDVSVSEYSELIHGLFSVAGPSHQFDESTISILRESIRFEKREIGEAVFYKPVVVAPLKGGKGGFGALLKAVGKKAGKKKTTDFGACRDLNGRRLRHINDEIKLGRWRKQQDKEKNRKEGKIDKGGVNDDDEDEDTGIDNWYLGTPTWSEGVSKKEMYKSKKRKRLEEKRAIDGEEAAKNEKEQRREDRDARVQEYANIGEGVVGGVDAEDLQSMVKLAKVRERVMKGKLKSLLSPVAGSSLEIKKGTVVGLSGEKKKTVFSTILLKGSVPQTGKWYYEAVVESFKESTGDNRTLPIQLGYASPSNQPNVSEEEGVGDVIDSVGWDGGRGILIVDGEVNQGSGDSGSETEIVNWENDDVVGVMYDCDSGVINYSLNGVIMPQNKVEGVGGGMTMGVSVNTDARVGLRLAEEGGSKCFYCPEGYRPVADLFFEMEKGGGKEVEVEEKKKEEKEEVVVATTTTTTTKPPTTTTTTSSTTPLILSEIQSHKSLETLTATDMSILKATLQSLGLKAGGSATERAQRLWTVKHMKRQDIPGKFRDKKTFDHITSLLE